VLFRPPCTANCLENRPPGKMDKRPALRGVVSRRRAQATTCFILHHFRPPISALSGGRLCKLPMRERWAKMAHRRLLPSVGRGAQPQEKAAHGATQAATVGGTARAATLVRDDSAQGAFSRAPSRHSAVPAVARTGTVDCTRPDSGPNAVDSIPPSWGAGVPSPHR